MSKAAAEPHWHHLPEERPKQIVDAALAILSPRRSSLQHSTEKV
jgi:hypothetical protein